MSKKMRAVRLFSPGDVRCVEVDIPQIEKDDDVIIKVKACGVCGSDIPRVMVKGAYRYPITIGHEFAGEVVSIGPKVSNVVPGDRVTVMPLIPCGECAYCKVGEYYMCDNYEYYGSRVDGAMAEYIRVTSKNCLKLPMGVDYEMGATTDPVSVALHAVNKLNVEAGQSAVVLGLGAIGYFCAQWLKAIGCSKVFVVDIIDEKLKLAERMGIDYCINGKKQDVVSSIKEINGGRGVDVAVEVAGSPITQIQALQVVRKAGKVVLCGISYDELVIPNPVLSKILRGELQIFGAWNSSIAPLPINEWESALMFMKNGKLKVNLLITHRYRLEECQKAFNMMHNREEMFIKVLFKPEE
jgi:L-iditol 2-dehydrogenase